jgi:hypothetical protein
MAAISADEQVGSGDPLRRIQLWVEMGKFSHSKSPYP